MASVDKIKDKMRRQPNGIRPEEADKVLANHGYYPVRTKGSHKQYRDSNGDVITVKQENPLKKVYVDDILARTGG